MKGKVNCTCGWSWNKSDSSAKDMYICHECGRDNSNNMKNGGWLDSISKAQEGDAVNNATQEGIDAVQSIYRNNGPSTMFGRLPFNVGSGIGLLQSHINNEPEKLSDQLGVIPNLYTQAASYMALYAEKEKENFKKFAENRDRGKTYDELVNEEDVNNRVIDKTYVPKPKIGELKQTKKETKEKQIPYKEKKEVNKIEIDNTRTIKPRRKDGGWLDNYNDSQASAPEGMVGDGFSNVGRNYSPAWGGQFQMGGSVYPVNYVPQAQEGKELTFLQPTSDKLLEGYMKGSSIPSTERAMSIGGENGEPAYLIPSFKYGQELLGPVFDPISEFKRTGEHLGGPFKTWQEADKWENETRHPAVEKGENIMFPQEQFQMGGSLPGATGHMYVRYNEGGEIDYPRTKGIPSNGPYAKKTMASAQVGKKIKIKDERLQGQVVKDNTTTKSIMPDKKKRIIENNLKEIGTNQKKIEDAKAYYKKYLNSPKARERITNMMDDSSGSQYAYLYDDEVNPVDQEIKNRLAGLNKLQGKFEYLNDFGTHSSSYYDTKKNSVFIRPNSDANISYVSGDENPWNNRIDIPNTIGHEIGHGVAAASNKDSNNVWFSNGISKKESDMLMRANMGIINAKNREEILKDKDNPEYKYDLDHDNRPSELKADIDALRYQLYRQGIYDPGTQDFTREHLEKAKPSFTRNRLNDHFTDDELIDLMNKLSYNENNSDGISPIAQNGKKFKLKDERGLVMKPSESTSVKRKDFNIEQSKENKAYINAVAAQKKETARRAKLTKDQREREDYNAYGEEHGTISKYTPETTWQRTKAIVSNPMTAAGYIARGENLPGNFQAGPRNAHDYAIDFINPLQGAAALSEIPGELSRGEFMNAGLSGLDALDLGTYAKGVRAVANPLIKQGVQQLGNVNPKGKIFSGMNNELNNMAIKNTEKYMAKRTPTTSTLSPEMEPYVSRYTKFNEEPYIPYQEDDYMKWFNQQRAKMNPNTPVQDPRSILRNSSVIDINDMRQGGIIKDDRGQWDHPGEITEIGSNQITMEGVPYDVLGISDTGDTKLMKPGKDYKFKGKKVTEFPMAKNGMRQEQKGLVNLDQLTNFTNYNKPQPGGWLNKYN